MAVLGRAALSLLERRRDIVAVKRAVLAIGEAWRHGLTIGIEEASGQRGYGDALLAGCGPSLDLAIKLRLHRLEEVCRDDRLVLSGIALVLVRDLAAIEPVAQEMEQGATAEGDPAADRAVLATGLLGADPSCRKIAFERMDRAEFEIPGEERADEDRLLVIDLENTRGGIRQVIAKREGAAHPEALLLRGRDLVADPFARDLALELGEGEQDVEGEPPHAGRGREGLRDRDEADGMALEDLDHAREVGEGAGEAVDLVDDDHIDPAGGDIRHEALQARAVHGAAGEAAIVVRHRDHPPALGLLAGDIGGTGLALGIERVEALFKPFLGTLAGIDGAAPDRTGRGLCRIHGRASGWLPSLRRPKKRGPFQRVPVAASAIAERLE